LARLAIPLFAVLTAFGFIALATLRWDEWVGNAVIQTCPCRKPYPAWQSIENRTMIVCNEGSLQAHWLDGCGSDPVAGNA
jgi:hypothetical protein